MISMTNLQKIVKSQLPKQRSRNLVVSPEFNKGLNTFRDTLNNLRDKDTSTYGLFPLFAWYLMDYVQIIKRLEVLTVKRKRNNKKPAKKRTPRYSAAQLGTGIICTVPLGINKLRKINKQIKKEDKLANHIGLQRFFDQATAHRFLNEFQLWHLKQLEKVADDLNRDFGEAFHQSFIVLDIDCTTRFIDPHGNVRTKPIAKDKNERGHYYQWCVGFVQEEAVAQMLYVGNTTSKGRLEDILMLINNKLPRPVSVARFNGGYLSKDLLGYIRSERLSVVMGAHRDWVTDQNMEIDSGKWIQFDERTKICDLQTQLVETSCGTLDYRVILVEENGVPSNGDGKTDNTVQYAIVENIPLRLDALAIYQFFSGRQTIDNFFQGAVNPLDAGKMPSQKLRGCQAYLQFVLMAYNLFGWFKKNFAIKSNEPIRWKQYEYE